MNPIFSYLIAALFSATAILAPSFFGYKYNPMVTIPLVVMLTAITCLLIKERAPFFKFVKEVALDPSNWWPLFKCTAMIILTMYWLLDYEKPSNEALFYFQSILKSIGIMMVVMMPIVRFGIVSAANNKLYIAACLSQIIYGVAFCAGAIWTIGIFGDLAINFQKLYPNEFLATILSIVVILYGLRIQSEIVNRDRDYVTREHAVLMGASKALSCEEKSANKNNLN